MSVIIKHKNRFNQKLYLTKQVRSKFHAETLALRTLKWLQEKRKYI